MGGNNYLTSGSLIPAVPAHLSLYYRHLKGNCQGNAIRMKPPVDKIRRSSHKSKRSSQGFTLIELVIVMVIVAIGVALAVPTWSTIVEKRKLTSAMEQVSSFLSYAQGEAVKRNDEVTISWNTQGGHNANWCIGASLGADVCDCTETVSTESDYCEIDDVPFLISQTDFVDITEEFMHMKPKVGSFSFDPIRGVMTNTVGQTAADFDEIIDDDYLFYVHSRKGSGSTREFELQLQMNITGRVRICTDTDRIRTIGGYPTC